MAEYQHKCPKCGKYRLEYVHGRGSVCYYCGRQVGADWLHEIRTESNRKSIETIVKDPYKFRDAILVGDKLRGITREFNYDATVIKVSGRDFCLKCIRKKKEYDRIYFDDLSKNYDRYDKDSEKRINPLEDKNWNEYNVKVGDLFIQDFYVKGTWFEVTEVLPNFVGGILWNSFLENISEDRLRKNFERRKG